MIRIKFGNRAPRAIGLMSGTSHDGVSAALVELDARARPPAKLAAFETYPYPQRFRAKLLNASSNSGVGAGQLSALNFDLGRIFGRAAVSIAKKAGTSVAEIDFIGSHGHTFFHLPPGRARPGETASTLQLGESAVIAAIAGIPVVSDFRQMDIALGGEGAPLAPLTHIWLFAHRLLGRAVQNIGGIGNITYVPPDAKLEDSTVIAFDTGPGGGLIDALAAEISGGKMRMDRDGALAARGRVNDHLLADLKRNRYFRRRPPKSTGRDEFGAAYLETIRARAKKAKISDRDLIATVTALTAHSIADAARRFVAKQGRLDQLIATGGGAHNPTLMRMISNAIPEVQVLTANQIGIDGDALEAVAFAILGYQMLRGRQGNIPSVTGARSAAVLGKLTMPPNPRK